MAADVWCDQCGASAVAKTKPEHAVCDRRRELEPPRYCVNCRRRMVVQVLPRGWSARCIEHGVLTG